MTLIDTPYDPPALGRSLHLATISVYQRFSDRSSVFQALLAGLFTWGVTALGATLVFFTKRLQQSLLDGMLGFSAGVMLAASYWSLLAPAISLADGWGHEAWFPPAMGFALGGLAIWISHHLLQRAKPGWARRKTIGQLRTRDRTLVLLLAITLHNVPEGLAVGVAFGTLSEDMESTLGSAMALTLGIGLQNFPEGLAVALPLRRLGWGRLRCFWYGQLSAIVEPMAAVIGAVAVGQCLPLMPYALAFAAGAMVFVVIDAVIPESRARGHSGVATLGAMLGFIVMMMLDVALG